jgi:hypothetical protein
MADNTKPRHPAHLHVVNMVVAQPPAFARRDIDFPLRHMSVN